MYLNHVTTLTPNNVVSNEMNGLNNENMSKRAAGLHTWPPLFAERKNQARGEKCSGYLNHADCVISMFPSGRSYVR